MKNWAEVRQGWLILGSLEENDPLVYVNEKFGRGSPGLADFGFLRRKPATGYCTSMKNWAEVHPGWLILGSREENQLLVTVCR